MSTPIPARLALSAGLVALFLSGCDQAGPMEPAAFAGRTAVGQLTTGEALPFRATYDFRLPVAPVVPCAGSVANRLFIEGEGIGTHLGRFTINLSQCDGPNGTLVDGLGTLVAANGDRLDFIYSGMLTGFLFPDLSFESHVTFTGGTGRFHAATGNAVAHGSVDVNTGTGPTVWEGVISGIGTSE